MCCCLFRFQDAWAQIISGTDEGVYGWTAINYLRGTLDAGAAGQTRAAEEQQRETQQHAAAAGSLEAAARDAAVDAAAAAAWGGHHRGHDGAASTGRQLLDAGQHDQEHEQQGSGAGDMGRRGGTMVSARGSAGGVTDSSSSTESSAAGGAHEPISGSCGTVGSLDMGGSSMEVSGSAVRSNVCDGVSKGLVPRAIGWQVLDLAVSLQTTFCVELEPPGDAASEGPQAHAAGPHPLRQLVLGSHTYHLRTHTFHKYGLNDAFDRSVSLALQVMVLLLHCVQAWHL